VGVVDRGLRPDLAGVEVEEAAAMGRVAFEDVGEVGEVDRQRP
jgi:hypothetical protein